MIFFIVIDLILLFLKYNFRNINNKIQDELKYFLINS